jgi:hypothetical protein
MAIHVAPYRHAFQATMLWIGIKNTETHGIRTSRHYIVLGAIGYLARVELNVRNLTDSVLHH